MYIGTIRPDETRTAELTGNSLEEIHAAAIAQLPDGFELAAPPVQMIKGSTALTATATTGASTGSARSTLTIAAHCSRKSRRAGGCSWSARSERPTPMSSRRVGFETWRFFMT